MYMRVISTCCFAALAIACGSNAGAEPQVAEPYRAAFERAVERADEGRSPTTACASVLGRAAATIEHSSDEAERAAARHATDACYVGVWVRYLNVQLDAVERDGGTCIGPVMAAGSHRTGLRSVLERMGEQQQTLDGRIDAAVGDRLRALCPAEADGILGTG